MSWRIAPSLAHRLAVAAGVLLLAIMVTTLVIGSRASGGALSASEGCFTPVPYTPIGIRRLPAGGEEWAYDMNLDGVPDAFTGGTALGFSRIPCMGRGGMQQ